MNFKPEYFSRQMVLKGFGEEAQQKLCDARVLVVGAGGLGCPVLQYLCASGVGSITIADGDSIDSSNLHRQILFGADDEGKYKAACAVEKLSVMYPWVRLVGINEHLSIKNAAALIGENDLVVDCTDNFPARYLVNDICLELDKPFVAGAIQEYSGQLSVYNYKGGPTFRCLFPLADESVPPCEVSGVIGALAGVIGSMQAMEVIKIITGTGEPLSGKFLSYDARTGKSFILNFERNETAWKKDKKQLKTRKVPNRKIKADPDSILVDVRERWEYEEGNIGGLNIPLAELPTNLDSLKKYKQVLLYCEKGVRSNVAEKLLQENGVSARRYFAG